MNSVSEALVYGTPMVVIPFVSDQPVNAECVEKLGVGKKLSYDIANTDNLKHTVLSLLKEDGVSQNIKCVQEWIKQAPGNKGGAEIIIDYYKNGFHK
jgi:UDP:flavonoid glycosyltransferase YjiC (YdhE family)